MSRKTMEVAAMKTRANDQLSRTDTTPQFQAGICTMLENVLMETGNYHGFQFIWWRDVGYPQWQNTKPWEKIVIPDIPPQEQYRRCYY